MYQAFWKDVSTDKEIEVLDNLYLAHAKSANRQNASTQAIVACGQLKVPFSNAVSAALQTIGGTHGPLHKTLSSVFEYPELMDKELPGIIRVGGKIPGWGNSFVRGSTDPVWYKTGMAVAEHYPRIHERISAVTKMIHASGKIIYPNAACYTAAVAKAIGAEKHLDYLFIAPRLAVWAMLWSENSK